MLLNSQLPGLGYRTSHADGARGLAAAFCLRAGRPVDGLVTAGVDV